MCCCVYSLVRRIFNWYIVMCCCVYEQPGQDTNHLLGATYASGTLRRERTVIDIRVHVVN